MAATIQVGDTILRKEVVDAVVRGFADPSYKFKQALSIVSTNAEVNSFWREDPNVLTAPTGNAIKGVPRGANFPQGRILNERISVVLEKYAFEATLFWEDIRTSEINLLSRTLYKISEGVVSQVDAEIWDTLTESQSPVAIQSFTIDNLKEWNGSSGAVIDDLMRASQLIAEKNYPTDNLICFISPRDKRSIMATLTAQGAQFPKIAEGIATNGKIGNLAGITLIESNNVTASYALVVVPKICGTWKQETPLTTDVTIDPFKSTRIRAVERGVTQLTDPNACVLIMNTQQA